MSLKPDSFFVVYLDDEMTRLYWHRLDRLEYFKKRRAPYFVIRTQRRLFRQARRVLHERGIECPERPVVKT